MVLVFGEKNGGEWVFPFKTRKQAEQFILESYFIDRDHEAFNIQWGSMDSKLFTVKEALAELLTIAESGELDD